MTKEKKQNTPLVDCLTKYARAKNLRMHMPCHVGRLGFLPSAEKIDITELGFNDNLNSPNGVIAQSQKLYAKLFGAEEALFLTNGSSQGNLAFLSLLSGKKVLVQKNSHVSVLRGAKLFDVQLILQDTITWQSVEQAVEKEKIAGVLVQYPDYFGRTVDLPKIYEVAQRRGVTLFVDGAHGAHFGLSEFLPEHPVGYCDACVVSTHKTLGAYTQTAVVLTRDANLAKRIKKSVNLLSSTSPSYILLASIDYARDFAERYGKKKLDELYGEIKYFCKTLPTGVRYLESEDFCKLCLDFSAIGASGKTAFEYLSDKGIYAELYDGKKVLFYLGLFTTKKDLDKLKKAIKSFAKLSFDQIQQEEQSGPFEYGEDV